MDWVEAVTGVMLLPINLKRKKFYSLYISTCLVIPLMFHSAWALSFHFRQVQMAETTYYYIHWRKIVSLATHLPMIRIP